MSDKVIHEDYGCDGCGKTIVGIRYHCKDCSESYDLCKDCYPKKAELHSFENHKFVPIKEKIARKDDDDDERSEVELCVDVLGIVVVYLNDPKDFMKLLLVSKSYYEYLGRDGKLTNHLSFLCYKFPSKSISYVSNIKFSSGCISFVKEREFVKIFQNLRSVSLVSVKNLKGDFIQDYPELEEFCVDSCPDFDDFGMVKSLRNLKKLSFFRPSKIHKMEIRYSDIFCFKKLEYLELHGFDIDDSSYSKKNLSLPDLPNIKTLKFHRVDITDDFLRFFPNTEECEIVNCCYCGPHGFEHLKKVKKLKVCVSKIRKCGILLRKMGKTEEDFESFEFVPAKRVIRRMCL